jgi:endoplasmic reticulum lectin 1
MNKWKSSNFFKDRESYTGPHALSILEKLFVSQACAYRLEHYWTYELCHGRFLRQFHEERDGKKIKVVKRRLIL